MFTIPLALNLLIQEYGDGTVEIAGHCIQLATDIPFYLLNI